MSDLLIKNIELPKEDRIQLSVYPNGKVGAEDINLEINKGDIFAFIGHNGAGKTNILDALYLLSMTKSSNYSKRSSLYSTTSFSAHAI